MAIAVQMPALVLFDTPILVPPQAAMLGTGAIVKRPRVIVDEFGNESIGVRSVCYLPLTYDHRLQQLVRIRWAQRGARLREVLTPQHFPQGAGRHPTARLTGDVVVDVEEMTTKPVGPKHPSRKVRKP